MRRIVPLAALAAAGLALAGTSLAQPRKEPRGRAGASAVAPDRVIQWNAELLTLLQVPGAQAATIHPTRTMAIMQLAVYDAVDAIQSGHRSYLRTTPAPAHASASAAAAAAAAAARTTLLALLPSQQQAIEAKYQQSLSQLGSSRRVQQGIKVGELAATAILAARVNDGSGVAAPAFKPGSGPGEYQLTPPKFSAPVFGQWPAVTPFALRSGDEFRPPSPPALASARYVDDFNEVKALGRLDSVSRSTDQTNIGKFCGAAPVWNVWNQIAELAGVGHHNTLGQNARMFALIDTGLADSVIALYDAKYAYHRWRPVTAITTLDTGNPAAFGDLTWTPLAATAPDPSYPGAHATVSETAAVNLAGFFGTDRFDFSLTNATVPGVVRSFASFSQAADEASASRIFAGQHFRYDEEAGQPLGRRVGDFVSDSLLPASPTGRDTAKVRGRAHKHARR
jgi:hypothetical protein